MNYNSFNFFTFLIIMTVTSLNAQERRKIEIKFAPFMTFDESRPDATILTRDNSKQVHIKHEGIEMWCDEAIYDAKQDFIEAYGKVKIKQGDTKCGGGPVLTYGPAVQNNLLQLIINTAEKNKIPFQRAAASRSTGTDTDAFAYANGGVASALISLPLRYMHTTVETVAKEDVENVIRLIYRSLQKIKNNHNFMYLT